MEASHKTHRPHIKVGKDENEEEEEEFAIVSIDSSRKKRYTGMDN